MTLKITDTIYFAGTVYLADSLQVSDCVAFAAPHFQSSLSSSFVQALLCKTFIEGATLPSSMPFALENSFHIGQHSDVLLFSLTKASSNSPCGKFICNKFYWWNKQTRPYGTCLPLCCPVCGALWCWDRLVWSGLIGEGLWSVGCANPHCSLGENGAQLVPRGMISGVQPRGSRFITPKKKRQSGWMVVTLLYEEIL
ncbi:hypothetical protein PAXRUDRAFT_174868 [Paxillus rubicundulus Ve08.2h10]|uniref:Uncharacterized protein n=1 Tax=Paxillus rubicundulus Ve08.2h10 TaxID=930991 RepID=A0A0D0CHM4_9AGAM|nr:hypothetical protein PAXRUDRAFT_174868 [Paxillus rubicundulus Ve08.2h10]